MKPDIIEIMARASYERELSPYGAPWSHVDKGSRRAFLADMRAALTALHEAGFVVVPAERVRDLADCLSDMTEHYVELAGSGDCGSWNPEEEQEVIAARRMIAAAQVPHDKA